MKDVHIVGEKRARSGCKTAIQQSLLFCELAKCLRSHRFDVRLVKVTSVKFRPGKHLKMTV